MHPLHHRTHRLLTLHPSTLLRGLWPAAALAMGLAAATPAQASPDAGLTRAEVREQLKTWRAAGLMATQTELGDTPDVLQRREEFYALQTEVMLAEPTAAAQAPSARSETAPVIVEIDD